MTTLEIILEILKYTVPAIIVLIGVNVIVKRFLVNEIERKRLAIFKETSEKTLMLRLQAYERLTIYIERIHPRSLVSRLYDTNLTNQEFHYLLIKSIQEEFEHNLSQQIYVSTELWRTIMTVKEQSLSMINGISSTLEPTQKCKEFTNKIFTYLQNTDTEIPIDIALEMINNEAKMVLSLNA